RRGVEPTDFRLALADDLTAVVDQAVDAIDGGALQLDLADIHFRRVGGAEDRRPDTAGGGVGGERRTGITIGRHRHVFYAERLAHRHRHHEAARLERAGRQPALILDHDLAAAEFLRQLWQANERRCDLAEADDIGAFTHR